MLVKPRVLLFLIFSMATATSWASDWKFISSDYSERMYVDLASMHKDGDHAQVWERVILSKTQYSHKLKKHFNELLARLEYDCSSRTVKPVQYATYMNKYQVEDFIVPNPEVKGVIPDTSGEDVFKLACGID